MLLFLLTLCTCWEWWHWSVVGCMWINSPRFAGFRCTATAWRFHATPSLTTGRDLPLQRHFVSCYLDRSQQNAMIVIIVSNCYWYCREQVSHVSHAIIMDINESCLLLYLKTQSKTTCCYLYTTLYWNFDMFPSNLFYFVGLSSGACSSLVCSCPYCSLHFTCQCNGIGHDRAGWDQPLRRRGFVGWAQATPSMVIAVGVNIWQI